MVCGVVVCDWLSCNRYSLLPLVFPMFRRILQLSSGAVTTQQSLSCNTPSPWGKVLTIFRIQPVRSKLTPAISLRVSRPWSADATASCPPKMSLGYVRLSDTLGQTSCIKNDRIDSPASFAALDSRLDRARRRFLVGECPPAASISSFVQPTRKSSLELRHLPAFG